MKGHARVIPEGLSCTRMRAITSWSGSRRGVLGAGGRNRREFTRKSEVGRLPDLEREFAENFPPPSILAVESWWKPIVGEDSELPREESSQVIWGPNVLLITCLSVIGYFA